MNKIIKMKYIYLILIVCLFTSCNSQNKSENVKNDIEHSGSNEFSLEQIKALYFLNKSENLNLKLFTESFSAIDIDSLSVQLLKNNSFNESLRSISYSERDSLYKKSNEWIQIKNALDFAIDNSQDLDYLEFFYNDLRTRKIFNNYLKNPRQDWGSLSSSEQYEVYYKIINEIYTLDSNNRLILMSDFYVKMK